MQTENANPQTSKAAAKRSKPSETSNPPMETLRAKGLQKQLHMAAHEHDKLLDGPTPEADPYCHFSLELQERTGVARQGLYAYILVAAAFLLAPGARGPLPHRMPHTYTRPLLCFAAKMQVRANKKCKYVTLAISWAIVSGYPGAAKSRVSASPRCRQRISLSPTPLAVHRYPHRCAPLPTPLCTATHPAVHCYTHHRAPLPTVQCCPHRCAPLPTPLCTATHTAVHCIGCR